MWYHAVLSRFSRVRLYATLWTLAHQAPPSMGFPRQEYWSGLPCPPSEDLPDPGIEPASLQSPAVAGGFFTTDATWEAPSQVLIVANRAVAALNSSVLVKHSIPLPKVANEVQNLKWLDACQHPPEKCSWNLYVTSFSLEIIILMALSLTEFVSNVYIWGFISLVLLLHIFQLQNHIYRLRLFLFSVKIRPPLKTFL